MNLRKCAVFCMLALGTILGAAPDKPKALVIMMDGARNDAFLTSGFTPLAQGEKIFGGNYHAAVGLYTETVPGAPTLSAPNHTGIATGVSPARTGVYVNGQTPKGNFTRNPHILSYLADQYKTAFLYGWKESGSIKSSNPKVEYLHVEDAGVEAAAAQRIRDDVDALYVYINAPDNAGHGFGFYPNSAQYRKALDFTRNIVVNLLKAISSRPNFADEDWLVIAVSDHGGYARTHGMLSNHARISILSVLGRHYSSGFLGDNLSVMDVPATVLHHFGINPVEKNLEGRVIASHVIPFSAPLPEKLPFLEIPGQGAKIPFAMNLDCTKEFSIFLQINAGSRQKADPPIFGNKNWRYGGNPGFALVANYSKAGSGPGYSLSVGLRNEPRRLDLGSFNPLPGKEVGILVSFFPGDKCYMMEYRGPDEVYLLTGDISDAVLQTKMKLHFGEDGTGKYTETFKSAFNGKLSNIKVMQKALLPDEMLQFCRRYMIQK